MQTWWAEEQYNITVQKLLTSVYLNMYLFAYLF